MYTNRQVRVTFYERRPSSFRLANHFNEAEAFHDLFPDDSKLHFSQPVTHTAVNAEAEREVLTGLGSINDELVGIGNRFFITITGDIPHH